VHLVLHVPLCRGCCGVTTTNDATATFLRQLCNGLQERLRALGEIVKLKHPGRPIPNDSLRREDRVAKELHRFWTAIHTLPTFRDALLLGDHLDLLLILEILTTCPIARQHDLNPLGLSLLH